MLTATYSVNGKPIKEEDLKNLQITKKDYIDFVESIIRSRNKMYKNTKETKIS